jgi:hypothetical protein
MFRKVTDRNLPLTVSPPGQPPTNYCCFQRPELFSAIPGAITPFAPKRQQVRSVVIFTQQL